MTKRVIALLIAATFAVALTACSSTPQSTGASSPSSSASPSSPSSGSSSSTSVSNSSSSSGSLATVNAKAVLERASQHYVEITTILDNAVNNGNVALLDDSAAKVETDLNDLNALADIPEQLQAATEYMRNCLSNYAECIKCNIEAAKAIKTDGAKAEGKRAEGEPYRQAASESFNAFQEVSAGLLAKPKVANQQQSGTSNATAKPTTGTSATNTSGSNAVADYAEKMQGLYSVLVNCMDEAHDAETAGDVAAAQSAKSRSDDAYHAVLKSTAPSEAKDVDTKMRKASASINLLTAFYEDATIAKAKGDRATYQEDMAEIKDVIGDVKTDSEALQSALQTLAAKYK